MVWEKEEAVHSMDLQEEAEDSMDHLEEVEAAPWDLGEDHQEIWMSLIPWWVTVTMTKIVQDHWEVQEVISEQEVAEEEVTETTMALAQKELPSAAEIVDVVAT